MKDSRYVGKHDEKREGQGFCPHIKMETPIGQAISFDECRFEMLIQGNLSSDSSGAQYACFYVFTLWLPSIIILRELKLWIGIKSRKRPFRHVYS